ncbi:protocatechuate 3,4-dioxygenase subunit alpha [Micromonospora sp. NPDC005173]|uniref:protocatechuate 3,4-dioxygenase subunit alpha n=1 Tax=Micromonospora sp. NPDC005173 TaxID=3157165 RepID=UPI0033BB5EF6
MSDLVATPGQTVGPFFGYGLPYARGHELVPASRAGAIRLHGFVYDGAGDPVPDSLIELWQADPEGSVVQREGSLRRDGFTFTGWGRAATDGRGHYEFSTLRPGAQTAERPAFFALTVFARGLLDRLFTRVYLPDDQAVLDADPFLSAVPTVRRRTLLAVAEPEGYRFDLRLQGDDETVFLRHVRS